MRDPCGSITRTVAAALAVVALKLTLFSAHPPLPGLASALLDPLRAVVGAAASVALGVYARSIMVGLLAVTSLSPVSPGHQWTAVLLGVGGLLAAYSYLQGPHDAALEALSYPVKPRFTPLLAAVTLAYAYWVAGVGFAGGPTYWACTLLGGALLAKLARTVKSALAGAVLASLGALGALTISLYASLSPLPPAGCGGRRLGSLVGYEADTSTTRSIAGRGRRWRGTVLACATGEASFQLGERATVWVYSNHPLELAVTLAGKLYPARRMVIVDVDSPGEAMITQAVEALRSSGPRVRVNLGSLDALMREGVLASLPGLLGGDEVVVVASCLNQPRDLSRLLEASARRAPLIAGFCRVSEGVLAPFKGPEGTLIVLGYVGDPLEASTVLGRLFGDSWRGIHQYLRRGAGRVLVHEYCGRGWAMVELSI